MRTRGSDLLVLCYHAVSPTWDADLSVTPRALEWQLRMLQRRGYRCMTFADATRRRAVEGRTLVITFDDAFESVHRLAYPILAKLGMPATVFVPTRQAFGEEPMGWPGVDHWLDTPHAQELRGMSREQLRELAADGWEIGAHTRTHACLTDVPDDELAEELAGSRADCERELGVSCVTVAYPFGAADARVLAAARSAGFEAAAGLSRDLVHRSRFYWPRVGVYYRDSPRLFKLKVSPFVRRVRTGRLAAGVGRHKHVEDAT
jgi:peptidoglycan/xylan/chitin deacetylase (PgdA/CDA1 family)